MSKILFVGAEAMPFAATGGLGDVMGSLPAAIHAADEGADVRVVMPLYRAVSREWREKMTDEAVFEVRLAWRKLYCGVKSIVKDGVTYYFIDNEYYFGRDGLYGHMDDGERYAYFCMAALEMLSHIGFYPDVLHAHDWQAALSVVYLDRLFRWRQEYKGIKTVFTIHNIEYQGKYDFSILGDIFSLGEESRSILEYDGCINLMKGAIVLANIVSTVSPRYAEEIRSPEYAHRLQYVINDNAHKLRGILNGIDYSYYNPEADDVIPCRFSADEVDKKSQNKLALQEELGLPVSKDVPMLSIISRLATHKGLDLVTEMATGLLETLDVQLVVLGKGDAMYESFFRELEARFPQKMRALICYDRDLSKRIYAATDIFIMPSKSEPCGLSQMIASRYGAVPVVRETGGLYDSIKGYYEVDGKMYGNGFTFADYSADVLYERTAAAEQLFRDKEKWQAFVSQVMKVDFSWSASAKKYLEMYQNL
jgi:starch synthase